MEFWHYAVVNRKDNTVGQSTYDKWCPPAGGGPRIFTAHMGEGLFDGLSIYMVDTEDEPAVNQENTEAVEAEFVDGIVSQQPVQQTVNNPFVFNFTQHGNNNTQIGHVEHYHAGKKED